MFRQNGKIHVGYKDLMENYQIVVSNLAAERGEKDTNLVLNVFQSLLDEFTRSYTKTDFEPTKVGGFTSPSPTPSGSSRCSSWLCLPPSSWPSSSRLAACIPLRPCPPPWPSLTACGTITSLVSHGPSAALRSRLWRGGCLLLPDEEGHVLPSSPPPF